MKFAHRILVLCALCACGASLSAQGAVTASLDRDRIAPGETVQLRLQHDGNTNSQPDIGPLRQDFDVLGSSSGSSVQIVNGHTSSQSRINLVLSPKHDGNIRIPSLQWDGQQSAPLELTVSGSAASSRSNDAAPADPSHVFLTATLDKKQAYVQASIVLTVKIHSDQPLYQASLTPPASNDVLVKQLDKGSQTTETHNGREYQVFERKYLLFPQRSGKFTLAGPVLDAQVQDGSGSDPFGNDPFFANAFRQMPLAGMLGSARPLRLHAKPIELDILPRPSDATGKNWLPARKVTLEESWRPDTTKIHVGEPLTRHLHLAALGLSSAQLPDLATLFSAPDGIKLYPDQAGSDDTPQGDTLLGSRDQDIALIASRPGHYTLPEVRLAWWDTTLNAKREVVLPAHDLDILPAVGGTVATATPPAPAAPTSTPHVASPAVQTGTGAVQAAKLAATTTWPWISLGLGMLWLGTAGAWWGSLRRKAQASAVQADEKKAPKHIHAEKAFKDFKRACRDNDPHAARQHLLAWAGGTWPTRPPLGLNELSRRLEDAIFTQPLRELDRACYTGTDWNGEALAKVLSSPPAQAAAAENKQVLPELYT